MLKIRNVLVLWHLKAEANWIFLATDKPESFEYEVEQGKETKEGYDKFF